MSKGLLKRIGGKIILPLVFTVIINGGCAIYHIGDSEFKWKGNTGPLVPYIVEKDKKDKTNYYTYLLYKDLSHLKINGKIYSSGEIFEKGEERFDYLKDTLFKIHSENKNDRLKE